MQTRWHTSHRRTDYSSSPPQDEPDQIGHRTGVDNHAIVANLITQYLSFGIDLYRSNNNEVRQNTISENGSGGLGTAGVRIGNPNVNGAGSNTTTVTFTGGDPNPDNDTATAGATGTSPGLPKRLLIASIFR